MTETMLPRSPAKRKVSKALTGSTAPNSVECRRTDSPSDWPVAARRGASPPGGDRDRPIVTICGLTLPLTDEELVWHEPARAQREAP